MTIRVVFICLGLLCAETSLAQMGMGGGGGRGWGRRQPTRATAAGYAQHLEGNDDFLDAG